MTARGGGVSLGSSDVYVKTDDRTKDQISFQQQLDAAQKMSWQGRVDSKMRRDAEIASNNTGGVVVHHQAAEIKVEDTNCILVENIPEAFKTQDHLLETFGAFGTVTGCVVYQLRKGEQPPTWALVAFETEEQVAACFSHTCPHHPEHPHAPPGHIRHPPGSELTGKHEDSHIRCTTADMSERLKWDEGGMMADIWLSLCTVTIIGITETACTEMIVSEALRLEYGCTPAHVTLFTDFNGTEVVGNAMVSFKNLESVAKLLATKPVFHRKEVADVRMCELGSEFDGDFATDDPRVLRMFARHRKTVLSRGSSGADILKIKQDKVDRDELFAEAEALETPHLAGDVAIIIERRQRTGSGGGLEYLVGWDGNATPPTWVPRALLAADAMASGMQMEFDDNLLQEQEAAADEARAMYKQLDYYGSGQLSASSLACRLHDFGLSDHTIEKLVFQMDTDHNGLISPSEFEKSFANYKRAVGQA